MKQVIFAVLALFFIFINPANDSLAMSEGEVEMFMSGGQDHRISCSFDTKNNLSFVTIERYTGTKLVQIWKSQFRGENFLFISSEFFGKDDSAIVLAAWDDEGALSYEIFRFSDGLLNSKWAKTGISGGTLIPDKRVIGVKQECQGRGVYWDKAEEKVKEGRFPTSPYLKSELGVIVEFKIDKCGKITFTEPSVQKGIQLKSKQRQVLVLVQNDDSPVVGKISFLGNVCWMEGSIPGSYKFPFSSQGEICITPTGFETASVTLPLVVE